MNELFKRHDDNSQQQLDVAKAISNYTPRKPIKNGINVECPQCGLFLDEWKMQYYCDYCGQRFDWSGINE